MAVFLTTVLSIWATMHAYVFWRLASVPWVTAAISRRTLLITAVALWASYPVARILLSWRIDLLGRPLEFLAANWIGVLFLLFCAMLAADVLTLGGWLLPRLAPTIRSGAAGVTLLLSLVGLVQGLRPPVIREYEVSLPGLPPERDGLVLVAVSDLHLGTLLGRGWLERRIQQINDLHPDLVVAVGDIIDGNVERVEPLLPVLRTLRAPLGVWAVTGNHEYYAGVESCIQLFQAAGFNVLRDRSAQAAPGLVLAGVDDLTARHQFHSEAAKPVEAALAARAPGGVVLLSHTPWQAARAAANGAGLMLCGHTHNGQIWPFSYLVGRTYPLLGGRYEVQKMPVIVCRGTGTWGPRLRLWWPAEILRVKLRAEAGKAAHHRDTEGTKN